MTIIILVFILELNGYLNIQTQIYTLFYNYLSLWFHGLSMLREYKKL